MVKIAFAHITVLSDILEMLGNLIADTDKVPSHVSRISRDKKDASLRTS